jgi:hypothetical protein
MLLRQLKAAIPLPWPLESGSRLRLDITDRPRSIYPGDTQFFIEVSHGTFRYATTSPVRNGPHSELAKAGPELPSLSVLARSNEFTREEGGDAKKYRFRSFETLHHLPKRRTPRNGIHLRQGFL